MLCRSASQGQRRLTKGARKSTERLHARKQSHSSSVSTLSTISARSAQSEPCPVRRQDEYVSYNPLCLHPTFHPPPRLHERPFIVTDAPEDVDRRHVTESMVLDEYVDVHEQDDYFSEANHATAKPSPAADDVDPVMDSPTPMNHERHMSLERLQQQQQQREQEDKENKDEDDYFLFKIQQLHTRTAMPRSRWSESTIQTTPGALGVDDDDDDDDSVEDQDMSRSPVMEREVRQSQWQNFSYKRNTVPRRPPLTQLNSIDNFIKRGGWKRRGIVFNQDEGTRSSSESLF